MMQSHLLKREQGAAFVLVGRGDPVRVQGGVQVDHVRHDGRADDADGQAQGVAAAQARHQSGGELRVVLAPDGEKQVEESRSDQRQQCDDGEFEAAIATLLEREDHERDDRGD